MSKTKMLINKTVTTTLILLLTLSILSVFKGMILPVKAFETTGTIYVSANYTAPNAGLGSSINPYGSIKWALLNCTGNAVIYVSPGTYNTTIETFPLNVTQANVTIASTGTAANTIINASGSTGTRFSTCVFNITVANATIGTSEHGFTMQSGDAVDIGTPGNPNYNPGFNHIVNVYGDNATIKSNIFYVGDGNTAGVHIARGSGTGHLIEGNTFRSCHATEGWGIMAENLTSSVIKNNLFYGDSAGALNSVAGGPGTGIMINDADNANITDNTAYYLKYTWLTFIASYPVWDSTYYMTELWRNAAINNIRVTNNTAHDCGRAVSFEPGSKAGFQHYNGTVLSDGTANLTIGATVNIGPSNKFYNNGDGIVIIENKTRGSPLTTGCVFGAANLEINTNDIYNSAPTPSPWSRGNGWGVWCKQDGPVNATFNWWGDPLGPRNATGSVLGDWVYNATYTPWLTVPHELDEAAAFNIYPTSGPPGSYVGLSSQPSTFTGATTNVTFYFSGTAVNSSMAESTGAMNGTFTVPQIAAGTYTVRALGNDSRSVSTSFTIGTPTITLSPTRGSAATPVTITGTNWNVSGTVNVDISNSTYSTDLVTGRPNNSTGVFTNATTIPSLAIGTYTINATDGINSATTSFIIPSRTMTLNVSQGPPSLPVLVTGEGYTKDGLVDIYLNTTWVASTTGSTTCGNISVSFAVPAKTAGPYAVKTHDVVANLNATGLTFTILAPSIYLNTTSGPPGKTIEAWGSNWNCSGYVAIYFGSTAVVSPVHNQTNSTGYLGETNNMTFVVPNLTNGTYTVNATDGINSNTSLTFTISAPTLWLNTTGGPAGSIIMINGTNWKLGTLVDIDIHNSTYSTNLFLTNPTAHATYGNFSDTFTIPTLVIGTYTINATDGITNHNATISFNVGCAISIDPSSGPANSSITVTGHGFTANANHTIWWDNTLKVTVNATDAGGSFTTNFTIPNVTAGTHDVWGQDSVTLFKTANVTFTVGAPSIYSLGPADGPAGTLVTVTGLDFQINSTVTVKFASMTANNTVTTNRTGGFIATFNVPGNYTSGPYTVNATASNYINSATATFTVTYGTGIDAVLDKLQDIEAKLDQYGSFWNFTNTWFTTISDKLGLFTGNDTVASLLYDIKTSVIAINFTSINNKLGTFSGTDTVASLLGDIKTSVSTINWTDITAIKAKTDTINWADIVSIKSTTALSIDYLWGLQDHPLWGLRTKVVPMLESIQNATQFTAGTYSTIIPTSTTPVDLGKSSKITLTVRATDDTTAGFVIKVYIYDGTAWRPLSFSVQGIASADCAATVEFTTGADGRLYFETTGATFTAFTYSAEFAP